MADPPPINPRLAARPTDPRRRLPIPYVQLVNPGGTANFAAIDGPKALRAASTRDCGLCGQRMGRWVAFLGGPRNLEHGGYLDPPMHVSCAEDATRLCPHLARQKVPRRPDGGDPTIITPPGFVEAKPDRWAMWITDSYTWRINAGTGTYVFLPGPPRQIRWWHYVNGRLAEQTP
jgi:hypothetical protein